MNTLEEAVHKLDLEMEKEKNNPYVTAIGEYLVDFLRKNSHNAPEFLEPKKTIVGSLAAMRKVAKGKAVKGMAMLTDEEGFAIVLEYFGAKEKPKLEAVSSSVVEMSLDDLF